MFRLIPTLYEELKREKVEFPDEKTVVIIKIYLVSKGTYT